MAATITPTTGFHHATGATSCDTISVAGIPVTGAADDVTELTIWADTVLTFITGGNISVGVVVPAGVSQKFMFDLLAAAWSPVQ
jgi:hypothetical protein